MDENGLETVFQANRERLIGFLRSYGAGEAEEDLLHELWRRLRDSRLGPLAHLYRAAII